MATNLETLRTELNECDNKGLHEVSIHVLRAAINELDRVTQLQLTQETQLQQYLSIENELDILRSQALRIQAERDAVVELHKQTVLALRGVQDESSSDQTSQD